MTEYVLVEEVRAVDEPEEEIFWTPEHRRGHALLEMWAAWSKSDPDRLGFLHAQPFAPVTRWGGRETISDDLAERIDGAIVRMPPEFSAVISVYYLDNRPDAFGQEMVLRAIREFLNAYDV